MITISRKNSYKNGRTVQAKHRIEDKIIDRVHAQSVSGKNNNHSRT